MGFNDNAKSEYTREAVIANCTFEYIDYQDEEFSFNKPGTKCYWKTFEKLTVPSGYFRHSRDKK